MSEELSVTVEDDDGDLEFVYEVTLDDAWLCRVYRAERELTDVECDEIGTSTMNEAWRKLEDDLDEWRNDILRNEDAAYDKFCGKMGW